MRRLTTVLVIAVCGALPATAAARAKPHAVVSAVTAQGPAAPGDSISARVTIARSGKGKVAGVKLGLALAPGKTPKGGTLLTGKQIAVKLGRARNVKLALTGVIPATVAAGQTRLFACIDAAKAVAKGPAKGRCKSARAPIQITTAGAGGKIDAALAAGKIDKATATLYRVYALAGDPRLPAEYRGPIGDVSVHGVVTAAADDFASLPADVQRKLFPFFTPPAARGSAWGTPALKTKKKRKKAKRSQLEGPVNCSGFSALDGESDHDGLYAGRWAGITAADGNSVVHYIEWRANPSAWPPDQLPTASGIAREMTQSTRAPAQRFAAAMPEIWSKLTREFGPPQSDGGVACYNGGDGRFDVYVENRGIINATDASATSLALPYPQVGTFCTNRPSFILMRDYEEEWTLAHEFMHALQFAHKYKSCGEPIAFWDEGGADWAANFVYPSNQRAKTRAPHNNLLTDPLGYAPGNSSYGWWPFWLMLEKTGGVAVLKSIFSAMENDQAVAAVDNAIPGGFKQQIPAFLIALWNQDPIGAPGFPVNQSFKDWANFTSGPPVPGKQDLALNGQHEATIKIETDAHSGELPLALGTIQQVNIPDDKVKEIRFKNGGFGHGVHVDAALHMADGSWKLQDWSKETTTLCRDNKPDEDVRDLIVFSSGVDRTQAFQATHELRGKDECAPPKYRIDDVVYTDNLVLNGMTAVGSCNPSTTQHNVTSLGYPGVADDPGGGMSPELPDGHREGLLHAVGKVEKAANFSGCKYNDTGTDWISCAEQSSADEAFPLVVMLKIPAGEDPPAEVRWQPRQLIVGDVVPVFSPCVQFGSQVPTLPAPIVTHEPRNKFFDAGQQTITLDAPSTEAAINGMISSVAHYEVKFTRINEDGTAYSG